jgi:hypothetical protein
LEKALDICGQYERKVRITGRSTGATGKEFTDYVIGKLEEPELEETWEEYVCA